MMCRKYGKVFKARNRSTGAYVAIRKMRLSGNYDRVHSNFELLKNNDCPVIGKCLGVISNGDELWVEIRVYS